jgi:hypothetical protein
MSGDTERVCKGCSKTVDIELELFTSTDLCADCFSDKLAKLDIISLTKPKPFNLYTKNKTVDSKK